MSIPFQPEIYILDQPEVIDAIVDERIYQDAKWHDWHDAAAFLTFIHHYVIRGMAEATKDNNPIPVMDTMRKIAALALACMEQNGVVRRDMRDFEAYNANYDGLVTPMPDGGWAPVTLVDTPPLPHQTATFNPFDEGPVPAAATPAGG